MLIALTGGSGFVGGHLARELAARGHELRCLVRATTRAGAQQALRALGAALVAGEMDDEAALRRLVDGAACVVHAAMYHANEALPPSRTARETYLRKNLAGGHLLLEFAAQAQVARFLLVSTLEVYGSRLEPPRPARDEDAPLAPDSLYGSVKYALETAGRTYAPELGFLVLRPGWVFGDQHPRERNCWHPIVDRLLRHEDIPVHVGAFMIWVEDLARLAAALLESPPGEARVFNAHSGFLDWYRVTEIGRDLLRSRSRITGAPAAPSPCPIVAERVQRLGVPFRVEEGVRRTLEHIARL